MADSSKNWFGVSMVLIGVIIGYGIAMGTGGAAPINKPSNAVADAAPTPAPAQPEAKDVKPIDPKRDHIRGNPKANIAVIEYSDYQCPFCERHHPTLQSLLGNNDDIMWVYRHFPLSFHPNAEPTAEASECVWEQGGNDAFWKFTDIVMEKGADVAKIVDYANEAGVNGDKVQDCVDSGKYKQYVADEMSDGSAAGVTGTPGNIVLNIKTGDSRLVSGAQPEANFQSAIDALK